MPRSSPSRLKPTARLLALEAIAQAASEFPAIDPQSLDLAALDVRERRLALAIHRTTLQRWLTLEHLVNLFLKRPLRTLEPAMQGVLLTGSAQLLFMDRLPVHAVVDESVTIARKRIRAGAAGMVNAGLRRVSELADLPARDKAWAPAADRLPLDEGVLPLRSESLPAAKLDEKNALAKHLSIATSHPVKLIERWLKQWDAGTVIELCRHGTKTPPTVVAVEHSPVDGVLHERAGYILWEGTHVELTAFLRDHPQRRVQDVTAAEAVTATASLNPKTIIDYCAGRGTKTRQLAALHAQATVIATDTDAGRMTTLRESFKDHPRVRIEHVAKLAASGLADLIVLDVPCTNTGVLARRPEARYRFNEATLKSLVNLQRSIIEKALPLLKPGGHVLYSTCSIDRDENQKQLAWMSERYGVEVVAEKQTLPDGDGTTYRDGGYYALLKTGER